MNKSLLKQAPETRDVSPDANPDEWGDTYPGFCTTSSLTGGENKTTAPFFNACAFGRKWAIRRTDQSATEVLSNGGVLSCFVMRS